MAYATIIHVTAQDRGRTYSATSKPTATEVAIFLEQTAAELDGILRARGYSIPVATGATSALKMLEHYNALGGAAMVEQGAVTGAGKRGDSFHLWEQAKKMLIEGTIELDADRDTSQSNPRFGSNRGDSGFPASPMFPLTMQT